MPGGASPSYRALWLLDHHGSRLRPAAIEAAKQLGFYILILPGSCTHFLQPWDQIFAPIKAHYVAVSSAYFEQHGWDTPLSVAVTGGT